MNTSSKRRAGSPVAHRCSFVCILSTRAHACVMSAGHRTSAFTAVSPLLLVDPAITLDPFAMRPAFPASDYYGSSAPPRPDRQAVRPAALCAAGCGDQTAGPGWFPRSLPNPSTGSASSYAPAPSPRLRRRLSPWPPDRRHHPVQEFPSPPTRRGCAMQPDPNPPGWSRWSSLEGLSATGSCPYASPSR